MKKRHVLRYIYPGQRKHSRIPISPRQLELVAALRQAPATRLELLQRDRPRLALNTPSLVAQLRARGLSISTEWETAKDVDGGPIRFARYALRGRVVRVEGGAA